VSNVVAAHTEPALLSHFDDLQQQDDSTKLGMWTFLATEVMFFGGMFVAYILFRWKFHGPFAEGSNELYMWFGFFNTGVLLCSSLSMALAVDHAKLGNLGPLLRNLVITMILGSTFLGVKAIEYTIDYNEKLIPGLNFDATHVEKLSKLSAPEQGQVELFFVLYFAMTGLHALHMVIGVVAIGILAYLIRKNKFADGTTVESLGLYWHFVDLVWVFLFPLLYLIDLNYKPH
jgi:cytochrome c oxidase subunit III